MRVTFKTYNIAGVIGLQDGHLDALFGKVALQ